MRAGVMVIGDFITNSREFLDRYPQNRKAARVSQSQMAFENAVDTEEFTENSSKCYFGAPIVHVLTRRNPAGFWPLHIKHYPYCDGEHWQGGGFGETPLIGYRTAHCAVGTAGHFMVGVAA